MSTTLVPSAVEALAPFVEAGVLGTTEIQFATTVAEIHQRLHPTTDPTPGLLLGAALAVRAPLHGSVCVDLATIAETVMSAAEGFGERAADSVVPSPIPSIYADADLDDRLDDDLTDAPALDQLESSPISVDELTWPNLKTWLAELSDSPLVAVAPATIGHQGSPAEDGQPPLVLEDGRLYLARNHTLERYVAAALGARADGPELRSDRPAAPTGGPTAEVETTEAVTELFARAAARSGSSVDPDQLAAALAVVDRDLVVIAGGPGTGKTTTVARLLAGLMVGRHRVDPSGSGSGLSSRVALAAPTGKAAARMTEALRQALGVLVDDLPPEVSDELSTLEASTIHRLLGTRPGGGFRHGPDTPLPHDIVIIDEVSMVSLSLMGHLLAAIAPTAKVVLVGDPFQLVSVEAGTVLSDVVGVGSTGSETGREPTPPARVAASVRSLITVHRQAEGSPILDLATAIRTGRTDDALEILRAGTSAPDSPQGQLALGEIPEVRWIRPSDQDALAEVQRELVTTAEAAVAAASDGDISEALASISSVKVLCARRRGDDGVEGWNHLVDERLRRSGRIGRDPWYPGRPTMVTENDYLNEVFNGDVGVAVPAGPTRYQVWFERAGGHRPVEAIRLDRVSTQWAMSIHKSQGSEFPHVVVVLPPPPSRILTRELLYTAVTRAKSMLTIVATEDAIRVAIDRPVARASGLGLRLN